MQDFIAMYPNVYEEEFNEEFLSGAADKSIEDYIIMCMKELESIENIEILDYKIIDEPDLIDINSHMVNINYKKKDLSDLEIPKHKLMDDWYYGEIRFTIRVRTNINEKIIEKKILYPIEKDGVFINNGKKMKAIWQLVDASIYVQRNKLTLKSRMPIVVYHNKHRLTKDIFDNDFVLTSYSCALEPSSKSRKGRLGAGKKRKTKFVNPLMLYCAKMGFARTLKFFGMDGVVEIHSKYTKEEEENCYIFPLNDLYIIVERSVFDHYDMVRAFVCMCINLANKDFPVNLSNLEDIEYWICRIGYIGSVKSKNLLSFYEKGVTNIYMIERPLNLITIDVLRIPDVYRQNIYYVLYWIVTNFEELKNRNNINMKNKRIRKNEYIVVSSLGKKINENINKLIERKSKSRMNTMDTLLELFSFGSDIIIVGMRNLNDLLKSSDQVNDMTFLSDMYYSSKGPNSLGESSSKIISAKYRYLDPSMVGVLDIFTTSNSDCGLSGAFTPYVKTYDGFFFNPEGDPSNARYLFDKERIERDHVPLNVDVSSYSAYIDDMREKFYPEFHDLLQYEKIEVIEKEETN